MATQRQILANRANAVRSTGPVTPAGKKIASQNSTRHGMLAQTVVLDGESKSRFEQLLNEFIALLQPRSAAEAAIVETMTIARWKQMRIWGIEKAGFQLEMARESSAAGANATRGYLTFKKLADNSRVLDLQHRYETGYERQFCRAYAFLLKLRAHPGTQPSGHGHDSPPGDPAYLLLPLLCATATWESPSEAPADDVNQAEEKSDLPEPQPDEPETNHQPRRANPVDLSKPRREATPPPPVSPVKAPETKDPACSQPVLRFEANLLVPKTQHSANPRENDESGQTTVP